MNFVAIVIGLFFLFSSGWIIWWVYSVSLITSSIILILAGSLASDDKTKLWAARLAIVAGIVYLPMIYYSYTVTTAWYDNHMFIDAMYYWFIYSFWEKYSKPIEDVE